MAGGPCRGLTCPSWFFVAVGSRETWSRQLQLASGKARGAQDKQEVSWVLRTPRCAPTWSPDPSAGNGGVAVWLGLGLLSCR